MLHILNKAWINCFLNQAKDSDKTFLFVVKDKKEERRVNKIISHFFQTNTVNLAKFGYYCITTETEIYTDLMLMKQMMDSYPMWDDILISSNIHDIRIKNFLHKHRIRKY
jgi:hypothetical protein